MQHKIPDSEIQKAVEILKNGFPVCPICHEFMEIQTIDTVERYNEAFWTCAFAGRDRYGKTLLHEVSEFIGRGE